MNEDSWMSWIWCVWAALSVSAKNIDSYSFPLEEFVELFVTEELSSTRHQWGSPAMTGQSWRKQGHSKQWKKKKERLCRIIVTMHLATFALRSDSQKKSFSHTVLQCIQVITAPFLEDLCTWLVSQHSVPQWQELTKKKGLTVAVYFSHYRKQGWYPGSLHFWSTDLNCGGTAGNKVENNLMILSLFPPTWLKENSSYVFSATAVITDNSRLHLQVLPTMEHSFWSCSRSWWNWTPLHVQVPQSLNLLIREQNI